VLELAPSIADTHPWPATSCGAASEREGGVLAVSVLSPGWRTIFFLIAVILFILGGVGYRFPGERIRLDSLGLAFFVFPFFWDAWAAY
jgi:hypothetical protein